MHHSTWSSRPSWIRELRKHLNLDCKKLMSGLRLSGPSRCYFSQPNTLCPKQRAQDVTKKGVHKLAIQNQVAKSSKASPIWPSPVRLQQAVLSPGHASASFPTASPADARTGPARRCTWALCCCSFSMGPTLLAYAYQRSLCLPKGVDRCLTSWPQAAYLVDAQNRENLEPAHIGRDDAFHHGCPLLDVGKSAFGSVPQHSLKLSSPCRHLPCRFYPCPSSLNIINGFESLLPQKERHGHALTLCALVRTQ